MLNAAFDGGEGVSAVARVGRLMQRVGEELDRVRGKGAGAMKSDMGGLLMGSREGLGGWEGWLGNVAGRC